VNSSTKSIHASRPPTEVTAKAKRRKFTAEYKQKVLVEADACERGGLGALLRREGLYSSHLVEWRRAREGGQLAGLTPKRRGPKAKPIDPGAPGFAQLVSHTLGLKAEGSPRRVAGQREFLAIGAGE
jgi:transposase